MKRIFACVGAVALLTAISVAAINPVGAAAPSTPAVAILDSFDVPFHFDSSNSYVNFVHGLNLDGQTSQYDGGNAVSVCATADIGNSETFAPEFGNSTLRDFNGATELTVDVFGGYFPDGVDCTNAVSPIIHQVVPLTSTFMAFVFTQAPGADTPSIVAVDLNRGEAGGECSGGVWVQAVHAANEPPASFTVSDWFNYDLSFGETSSNSSGVPGPATMDISVDGTPIVDPVAVDPINCTGSLVYLVGNIPVPEVTTTTTAAVTTTTATAEAAAATATAPTFTG
ncbi:MAG: hypothetical protein WCK41_12485 [Actinomycetes bacterium]